MKLDANNKPFATQELEVSEKHVKLRVIIFIIALIVAIGGIGFGIYSLVTMNNDETGWVTYTMSDYPHASYPQYSDNLYLYYYLGEESKNSNKGKQVARLFQSSAQEIYPLIDSNMNHEYTNVYGISYINNHVGEKVQINETLYDILSDAKEKTYQEGSSYSVFSGLTNAYWKNLFAKNSAFNEDNDPLTNQELKDELDLITSYVNDLSNFSLDLENTDGKYYVTFNISSSYDDFLANNDYLEVPTLDLNSLFYSYYLDYMYARFAEEGFISGTLYTHTGEMIFMSDNFSYTNDIMFYDLIEGNNVLPIGYYANKGKCYVSQIRAFPCFSTYEGEYATSMWKDSLNKYVMRNLFYSYKNGYSSQTIRNSMLVEEDMNSSLVDTTYLNLNGVLSENLTYLKNVTNSQFGLGILDEEKSSVYMSEIVDMFVDYSYTVNSTGQVHTISYLRKQA